MKLQSSSDEPAAHRRVAQKKAAIAAAPSRGFVETNPIKKRKG